MLTRQPKIVRALQFGALITASCACSSESGNADGSGGSGNGTGDGEGGANGPVCTFDSVQPDMTCGSSNDGMVCPASTYCDGCAQDVTVNCTCVDSGTSFGYQFQCDACETGCGNQTSTDTGSDTNTGTGTGTGPMVMCAEMTLGSCSAPDPVACECHGCTLGVCSDGAGNFDDCVCPSCADDAACSDPEGCTDNGLCDPYYEGCHCADCAAHQHCQ